MAQGCQQAFIVALNWIKQLSFPAALVPIHLAKVWNNLRLGVFQFSRSHFYSLTKWYAGKKNGVLTTGPVFDFKPWCTNTSVGNDLDRMTVCNLSSHSMKVVNYHTWCLPLFLTDNKWDIFVCVYDILLIDLLKVMDTKKLGFFCSYVIHFNEFFKSVLA